MIETPRVEYLPCALGGYHFGEVLNMVCLEQPCQQNSLCCCACVEESHKDHKYSPLTQHQTPPSPHARSLQGRSHSQARDLQHRHRPRTHRQPPQGLPRGTPLASQLLLKYRKEVTECLEQIEAAVGNYYANVTEQLKLKNTDPQAEIEKAFQLIKTAQAEPQEYAQAVKRVCRLVGVKSEGGELSEADIMSSLSVSNEEVRKHLVNSMEDISKKSSCYLKELQESVKATSIWKQSAFKFNPLFKHPDIKILQDAVVKSSNSSGYKFAVMDPHLESGPPLKSFAFRIKESSSNWVAVGMCHKNVVAGKNYGFNFSAIGHGAYMVSANGGSWSHTKVEHNNSVKAFKFTKGDVIGVKANFAEKTVLFKRNKDTYSIPFETIPGDELRPCVLFYYLNDEVEFLPNFPE